MQFADLWVVTGAGGPRQHLATLREIRRSPEPVALCGAAAGRGTPVSFAHAPCPECLSSAAAQGVDAVVDVDGSVLCLSDVDLGDLD
ncbi:MAG: hypothetical protein JWQ32_3261 [Marmoricola sp.]|nr:hypothetical protein [Marmoricola sp.]